MPPSERFARARALVTKHYQWMLRTDYLPRICAQGVVNDVFAHGRKAFAVGAPPDPGADDADRVLGGWFRMGHSMVRAAYNWNRIFDDGTGTLDLLFIFTALSGDLGGRPRLASSWIADFRRLYDFGEAGQAGLTVPEGKFNRAMRIDTILSNPLGVSPAFRAASQTSPSAT